MSHYRDQRRGNKVFFGILIIIIGLFIFLKQVGLIPMLDFHANWPLILIAVGLLIGVKNRFSSPAPYILIAIGIFNYIPAFTFTMAGREVDSEDIVLPFLLVLAGLVIILKPKKKHWTERDNTEIITNKSVVADVVFGGRKEIITSKDFRGGKVTATFGGVEINMLQADSPEQNIVLEVRATFGGCEIIVPSNWDIKNEVETIMGSVEDKRTLRTPDATENRKTLILRGSCFCGGIEIKSF
ncbi:MAG TPA: LiaF-related protein [Flavipsychrobacter sp.]|nr:LiaF-related protein [Flavipsychrobacter sp.]